MILPPSSLTNGNYYVVDHNHNGTCEENGILVPPHPKFGASMLAPTILSWIFVAKKWYKIEQGIKQKLMTVPLLILQVYPQWRALRVIYHGKWRKTNGWQRMRDAWEMEMSYLGENDLKF